MLTARASFSCARIHPAVGRSTKRCTVRAQAAPPPEKSLSVIDRRTFFQGCVAVAMVAAPAAQAEASLVPYSDDVDKFALSIPEGWEMRVPEEKFDRFRSGVSSVRTMSWVSPEGTDMNVTVVITTPGADYVTLGSFGSPEAFGANLVSTMDRSFMLRGNTAPPPDLMVSKLVSTKAAGDYYFVEYTTQRGVDPQKHLYSTVALGSNSKTRRFYTVTAICPESRKAEVGSMLAAAVTSLKLTAVNAA